MLISGHKFTYPKSPVALRGHSWAQSVFCGCALSPLLISTYPSLSLTGYWGAAVERRVSSLWAKDRWFLKMAWSGTCRCHWIGSVRMCGMLISSSKSVAMGLSRKQVDCVLVWSAFCCAFSGVATKCSSLRHCQTLPSDQLSVPCAHLIPKRLNI